MVSYLFFMPQSRRSSQFPCGIFKKQILLAESFLWSKQNESRAELCLYSFCIHSGPHASASRSFPPRPSPPPRLRWMGTETLSIVGAHRMTLVHLPPCLGSLVSAGSLARGPSLESLLSVAPLPLSPQPVSIYLPPPAG